MSHRTSAPPEAAETPTIARAGRYSTGQHLATSALWFALFAQWLTIVPIMIPDQVAGIIGGSGDRKEAASGSIVAAGAVVALLVAPLAGSLSDRAGGARGRRRNFLIFGMVGSSIGLALLTLFGAGGSLFLYALAIINLQFWWNWAAGPYAGLVPDVVPAPARNLASSWLSAMGVLGTIAGSGLMAMLYAPGNPRPMIAVLIGLNILCLAVTLGGVREPPAERPKERFDLAGFVRAFYLDPRENRNFYWVVITRLVSNMGVWSIFTFLLFYLQDVIGLANAANVLPALLGAGAIVAIPAGFVGVRLAARYGLVRIVLASNWIMAASAICYVLIALEPSLALVVPVVIVFSASYGAYQAVDWALALAVLPDTATPGKDMGIWHIALVLPQIIGPVATGWLISEAAIAVSTTFAYTLAFAIAAGWLFLAAILVRRIRLPER